MHMTQGCHANSSHDLACASILAQCGCLEMECLFHFLAYVERLF
jgi:hypothetical protein